MTLTVTPHFSLKISGTVNGFIVSQNYDKHNVRSQLQRTVGHHM